MTDNLDTIKTLVEVISTLRKQIESMEAKIKELSSKAEQGVTHVHITYTSSPWVWWNNQPTWIPITASSMCTI